MQGWCAGYKLTGRHGREVVVRLPRPISLSEPIQLPAGDWADITLTLDGPVTVWVPGASPVMLEVDSITVTLEAPDAREILLDWTLPEGTTSALCAGIGAPDLASALEDGALAR